VAVLAAWGGGGFPFVPRYAAAYERENRGRLLVFRLDGGDTPKPPELPPLTVAAAPPPQAAGMVADTIARGQSLFLSYCVICHANQQRSITPDLRRMSPGRHAAFDSIVRGGALVALGMPRWDDLLSSDDVAALHAYFIDAQGKTREEELAKQAAGLPLDAPSPAILSTY
jgi:quinohemoprotein ethanol dehydrogenase